MRASGIRKGVCRATTASLAYGGKERVKSRNGSLETQPERGESVRFGSVRGKHGVVVDA